MESVDATTYGIRVWAVSVNENKNSEKCLHVTFLKMSTSICHLQFICENCSYYEHCFNIAKRTLRSICRRRHIDVYIFNTWIRI